MTFHLQQLGRLNLLVLLTLRILCRPGWNDDKYTEIG